MVALSQLVREGPSGRCWGWSRLTTATIPAEPGKVCPPGLGWPWLRALGTSLLAKPSLLSESFLPAAVKITRSQQSLVAEPSFRGTRKECVGGRGGEGGLQQGRPWSWGAEGGQELYGTREGAARLASLLSRSTKLSSWRTYACVAGDGASVWTRVLCVCAPCGVLCVRAHPGASAGHSV